MASIEKVFITNFKSYKSYSLSIDNNIKHVVVYGYNGVGKTNLLDSISYFSNSKGLRGSSIEEILPKNQSKDKNTQIEIQIRSLK